MLLQQAIDTLTSNEINRHWETLALDWPNADAEQRTRALAHVFSRRDRAVTALREIGDDEQLMDTLAVLYIELKCEWIMINTVVNYQMFRTGQGDGETVLRGALVSSLLERVESLLSEDDVRAITEFLSQPVRQRRPDAGTGFKQAA